MIIISNSPIESIGIYYDTFISPVLTFKVIFFYEFTVWTSKMLRDIKMILGQWWNESSYDGVVTSAESSFESIQIGFVDLSEDVEPLI